MKHDIIVEGEAFRLRPLAIEDAAFIVALRTDPVLGRHLHATSPLVEDQENWTRTYFEREGDWYFIVEHLDGEREGAISIYNHNPVERMAEWGRWILRRDSLAAVESAALIHDIGFGRLNLELMFTHTEEDNQSVVSFHRTLGAVDHGRVLGPEGENWIEQRMTSNLWREKRSLIEQKIHAAARLANR